jgi:hypothetical protein
MIAAPSGDIDALLTRTSEDFHTLRDDIGPLVYVLPAFSWLPRYGGDLENAPALLEFGDLAIGTARDTLALGRVVSGDADSAQSGRAPIGVAVLHAAQSQGPLIRQVSRNLQKMSETRSRIDAAMLSPSLREALVQFDTRAPLWQMGIDALGSAHALLGADRPKVYLLIAQNSDELRATGGFVSGVALLRVEQGKITVGEFQDSFAVDDMTKTHPRAPEPLFKYMYAWQWLFRDGNWSPDLPTSARQLISMYQLDRGIKADGVIAVNLKALPAFLDAVGPINIEGYADRVDALNVASKIETYWAAPPSVPQGSDWWSHRKDFIADLFKALMARLTSDEFDRAQLARALADEVSGKDLWIYLNGEDGESRIILPPGGSLYRGPGDALMLVDSNVGFNKVDDGVSREIEYSVSLQSPGFLQAATTITYTNLSPSNNSFCVLQPLYFATYADLRQACYWDYVRLLAPAGAEMLSATGLAEVTRDTSEPGRTTFGGYLLVPRGESRRVRITYRLPQVLEEGMLYSLRLEKQPGAPPIPVTVRVTWPDERESRSASPEPVHRSTNDVEFVVTLEQDAQVRFTLADKSSPIVLAVRAGLLLAAAWGVFLFRRIRAGARSRQDRIKI